MNETTSGKHRRYRLSQSDHLELIKQSVPFLENKTLIATVVVREPFVIYNEPEGLEVSEEKAQEALENYSGVAIEVVKRLARIFRFKLKIMRPKDNQFGVKTDRGWTGLLGTLVRNESDLGVTALSITEQRAQVIDFTRAYYVETTAILLRIPEEVQNYFAIFEPFAPSTWIVLSVTIVVLIFLITIMTKLEEDQRRRHRVHKLAKFIQHESHKLSESRDPNYFDEDRERVEEERSTGEKRRYSMEIKQKLAAISEAELQQEFGSNWVERFYYATSCVLNILMIRGE